ncbi:MAG: hypothetical protein U5K28_10430 [Halobacteriales archaeon]|nr:hypothetical protein [Halobacteriales archaeon]
MGFSVSGATAVVFIGLLISASTLYPAVEQYSERRSEAIDARDERSLTMRNTAIDITSATVTDPDTADNTKTLTVVVDNDGASTLAVSKTDLLVDGTYRIPDSSTVDGTAATDVWASGETLELTLIIDDSASPTQVKVVTGPGIAATAEVT